MEENQTLRFRQALANQLKDPRALDPDQFKFFLDEATSGRLLTVVFRFGLTLYSVTHISGPNYHLQIRRNALGGRLSRHKWHVSHIGGQSYFAERIVAENREYVEINAHCLACAKMKVLTYGGEVDLRGWKKGGICGSMLLATATAQEKDCTDKPR